MAFCLALVLAIAGCGGDSSSSKSSKQDTPPEPRNVAAEVNGGKATATYDSDNAYLVNDGETEGDFWSGNVVGDHITIEFDKAYEVSGLELYTNAANNSSTSIQFSSDGENFDSINLLSGDCFSMQMGSGRITCTFYQDRRATHARVVIKQNAHDVRIYELIVTGT
ncbi:hypothetical protein CAI21_22460 [Alkalilimnicola ehrlichii]|uniref:F5/8 type C domain-containing protein n=2 Tax=Alkalilimnicola ehrlichii TaxID=351052 RepID=A0A3E0WG60_9GAMM|nr:hypothetical protein CAI21_22460 [Alkalilimnicola ehrlichii]RFA31088.1 hypothetical protein CAL65_22580 [Alkalilimnicola ehrlichii]